VVTSGLGGRFPRGYPVGEVKAVSIDPISSFAVVSVKPAAQLDRSRHVLITVGEIPEVLLSLDGVAPEATPNPLPAAPSSDATAPLTPGAAEGPQ